MVTENNMAKTYVPEAIDKATDMSRYFGRWAAKMSVGASTDQLAALADLIACIATFLARWHKPTPNP